MHAFRPSLTVSILAFLSCLLLLTWLLFSLLAFKTAANDLYSQKGEHARMLLSTFVNQLPETLPNSPEGVIAINSAAAYYAQRLSEEADFVRLIVMDSNNNQIYFLGRETINNKPPKTGNVQLRDGSGISSDGSLIVRVTPIIRSGNAVGAARLVLSLSAERARLDRSRQLFMAYFVIDFILLLGFGSFMLSRIVVTPINRLLSATEKITGGHYGQKVRVSGSLEMVRLAESFNEMSLSLSLKDQEVKRHVAALEQVNDDLRLAREETLRTEKMASVGLLAAGTAHEIGTPLASIMGYAELVASERLDGATIQDYAERITQDCGRIDRIVRGLLDYSRPRKYVIEPCNVCELVKTTLGMLTEQGALKGVDASTECDEAVPEASVDPHQLQQVLINLVINGRDALAAGGRITVRIVPDTSTSMTGEITTSGLKIEVADNGSGISEENLSRIFDPFFTTKQPGKGTGLGLAISARIIEGFGGRISVRSEPGRGSCFSIFLPAYFES